MEMSGFKLDRISVYAYLTVQLASFTRCGPGWEYVSKANSTDLFTAASQVWQEKGVALECISRQHP